VPPQGWPRRNFINMFDAGKTRMIGLPYGEKNYDDMLSRFHLIPERKRQTDRFAILMSRVSMLTRDNNPSTISYRVQTHLPLQISRWLDTGILVTSEICSANCRTVGLLSAASSWILYLSLSRKHPEKKFLKFAWKQIYQQLVTKKLLICKNKLSYHAHQFIFSFFSFIFFVHSEW